MATPAPDDAIATTTRDRLISATEQLLHEGGLNAVTTQSVARTAGCAEGTIYRHFDCRDSLIASTIGERLPVEFDRVVGELMSRAGKGDVETNLRDFVTQAIPFFRVIAPFLGMLAANKEIAARQFAVMSEKKKGPKRSIERIQAYFQEEQGLGRIGADVDPRVAASLLIGVCFHRSLLSSLFNEDPTGISDDELPGSVAACLWHGLAPSNEGTSA